MMSGIALMYGRDRSERDGVLHEAHTGHMSKITFRSPGLTRPPLMLKAADIGHVELENSTPLIPGLGLIGSVWTVIRWRQGRPSHLHPLPFFPPPKRLRPQTKKPHPIDFMLIDIWADGLIDIGAVT